MIELIENVRTVIVGSGVSGISSALNLLKNGHDEFLIIEAMNRIGGRCFTSEIDNGFLEHGAQLIHGQYGNPIFDLAIENDLIVEEDRKLIDIGQDDENFEDDYENNEFLNTMDIRLNDDQLLEVFKSAENGEEIPNSLAKKFFEAAERAFHCAQNYFKKQLGEYEESDMKVGSYLYEKYLEFVENDCQESKHLRKIADGIFVWRFKWENIEKGCNDLFSLSLKHLGQYTQLRGNQVVKLKRGYCDVIEALIRPYKCEFNKRLRLEHVLKRILLCERLNNRETVTRCKHCEYTKDINKSVLIVDDLQSKRELILICDFVISTMSLGCLKDRIESLIEPKELLPIEKIKSVQRLGFGSWIKVFLVYSEPFWESNFQGLHPIWLSESVQEAFGVNRDRDHWTRGIASFKPVHSHKNALCAYISGYECVEQLTDQEIVTECTKLLRKLMGTNIPEPKCIIRTSWNSNPFVRGAYSNLEFGSDPSDTDYLSQPISFNNKPFILFAGEATHKTHFSTVHGAYFTGVRESNRILDFSSKKL